MLCCRALEVQGVHLRTRTPVVFLFILKITAMFWSDNVTGEIIL